MLRWLLPLVCVGCGDNLQPVAPDAAPPDAAMPDALTCEADLVTDESNCGACEKLCNGGEVCKNSACICPTGIVPGLVFPTGFEQFFPAGGFTLVLTPTLSLSGVNGLV